MTFDAIWFKTTLPKVVIDSFLEEAELFDNETAALKEDIDLEVRDSKLLGYLVIIGLLDLLSLCFTSK